MIMVLLQKMNGDSMFPPPEETIRPGDYVITTWDLETTDRHFDDLICQIGAFCPGHNTFNQYVLPTKYINHEAAGKIHLQVTKNTKMKGKFDFNVYIDLRWWCMKVAEY